MTKNIHLILAALCILSIFISYRTDNYIGISVGINSTLICIANYYWIKGLEK